VQKEIVNDNTGKKLPATKPVISVSAGILALTISVSIGIYVQGLHAFRAQAKAQGIRLFIEGTQAGKSPGERPSEAASRSAATDPEQAIPALLKQMEEWALKGTLATAAGGAGLMLAMVFGVGWLRRGWSQAANNWKETAESLTIANASLQTQLGERKGELGNLEKELRALQKDIDQRVTDRTAALTKTYSAMEAELNSRKQAEKTLAYQAQELGRSKDVLQLHVQARAQELEKLQRRYEHILNSAGEGIYGLDLQGRTTFINPAGAKLTGWTVEELIGKSEAEVFHKLSPNTAGKTAFIARNGVPLADEVFFRKDGTSFSAECVRTPIMEKDRLVGAVVMFKDITERKRNEEILARKAAELARSNAELEQFAYVASHDLQEPLRKIQAFGDRLKAKCDAVDLKEGRDYLERMQSASARMQTLINDLLTFSRVISTTEPFVPVDLAAITKEVLADLEVRIEQTKAKVEVGTLPTIDADPLQMRQLLQNLLGNALKFQPADSQPVIEIQAKTIPRPFADGAEPTAGDLCELTVKDNGIGFDEKYLEKIFAMFQRLHGRTEYEGTGVGLAVCRRIADRHGGTINARSKPGEGATFIVTLPVRQQTNQLKAAA